MKNGPNRPSGDDSAGLDTIDRQIISELVADGRVPLAELGRRISLSPPATAERVRRLEQAGVITGYHARVDMTKLGVPIHVVMRLTIPGSKGARTNAQTVGPSEASVGIGYRLSQISNATSVAAT